MTTANPGAPLLVVGAGPSGLMMASQLARHGASVRVIDKAPQASTESKALALQSRTLEIFDDLGIIQQTLALGLPIHGANMHVNGKRVAHIGFDELESPYPFIVDLPQSLTERLLGHYLEGLGVQVEREVELAGFTQDAQAVTVTLGHADGRQETVVTPWLVGCDGAHSTTRHTLGLPFEGAEYPEAWVLADVKVHWSQPDDEMSLFLHEEGPLAVFPMRGGRARLIAEVPVPAAGGEAPPPTLADIQRLLTERSASDAVADDPVWIAGFRIHRRHAPHNRVGRVFLVGDAMHIHSPAGGQGMNTGLQDAYNLAWKLSLVATGKAPEALLDSYSAEREPVVEGLLRFTDALTRLATMRNPVVSALRNHLLGFLAQQEVIQQRAATQIAELNVGYRSSPIVGESEGSRFGYRRALGGPRPGDRAPDARPLIRADGSAATLFDVLRGTQHTLLLFAGLDPGPGVADRLDGVAAALSRRYGELLRAHLVVPGGSLPAQRPAVALPILDPELSLHHRYGADAECLYLIRPDKYVGYRAQPAEQSPLEDYLRRIFL